MLDEMKLAEMMKPVPYFSGLSQTDLLEILRAGAVKKYQNSDTLFWEGDPCSGLFVLLEGEIHLYKHGPEGQENIMGVIQPISMFNEVAVLDGGENPATARVFSSSIVWQADKESFDFLLHTYSEIPLALLPILARRNRRLVSQYEDMCFLPVRARTAKLLLELSST
jgi:CRP/FNR family transcriptional regulator